MMPFIVLQVLLFIIAVAAQTHWSAIAITALGLIVLLELERRIRKLMKLESNLGIVRGPVAPNVSIERGQLVMVNKRGEFVPANNREIN